MSFQCMFYIYSREQNSGSRLCLAAPCRSDEHKVYNGTFRVYLEPAGTSMLRVARAGLDVVLPTVILLRLLMSACQEGIFLVVM